MKKLIAIFTAVLMILCLAACGSKNEAETAENKEEQATEGSKEEALESETSSESEEEKDDAGEGRILVVYFSATGTTRAVAEKIADITHADIYEIKAAQEYTAEDLNYNDPDSRTTHEQDDPSVRPEIGSDAVSLDGYGTIYIGYPIWWGEEPRIMDTFVEAYDFDGITVIPFCTSSSSGVGRSDDNLAENAGSGNWLEGKRFGAGASVDEIRDWIEGLQ